MDKKLKTLRAELAHLNATLVALSEPGNTFAPLEGKEADWVKCLSLVESKSAEIAAYLEV
jgi:hypothetical protein